MEPIKGQSLIPKKLPELKAKWETVPASNTDTFPLQRYNFCTVMYKGLLFVYGGLTYNSQAPNNSKFIYRYNYIDNYWSEVETNTPSFGPLPKLRGQAYVLVNNMIYFFGGADSEEKCYSDMYTLNMQSTSWKKIQQKGDIPYPRQCAKMMLYKGHIFLFGGKYMQKIYNDYYVFKFDNKTWVKIDAGMVESTIRAVYQPAVCTSGQYIYMFGGQYLNSNNQRLKEQQDSLKSFFCQQFYQINVQFRITSSQPLIHCQEIKCPQAPSARSGHSLTACENKKDLILCSGSFELQKSFIDDTQVWVYHIPGVYWVHVLTKPFPGQGRMLFGATQFQNKIFTFGGYDIEGKITSKLGKLTVNLQVLPDENVNPVPCCQSCIQFFNDKLPTDIIGKNAFIDALTEQMQYPFAAFGLLIDNANIMQAKTTNIIYQNTPRQKYCLIEDNGTNKIWGSNEQFIKAMIRLTGPILIRQQIKEKDKQDNESDEKKDKKVIKIGQKDKTFEKRTLYSFNLKAAGFRLGKTILYVNRDEKSKRAVLFRKQKHQSGEQEYKIYYYILYEGKYLDPKMYEARKIIDQQYKSPIRMVGQHKSMNNFIFILDWNQKFNEDGQAQPQLTPNYIQNDVIYGDQTLIPEMQGNNFHIYDCIDISLRTYLSLLFINFQNCTTINLGVRQSKLQLVQTQIFLQKIDKNVKNKHLFELDEAIDFPLKINELYYNPDLKRKNGLFHNGVLLYHNNRLINRYRYKLGSLLQENPPDFTQGELNILAFFGYMQLPDTYPVNNMKTSFLHSEFLQNFYSRLRLIDEIMGRKALKNKQISLNKKKSGMRPQGRSQDVQQSIQPSKRLKLNDI